MEFNIDFGNISVPARPATQAPLYAAVEGRVSTLGGDEAVFFDTRTGSPHVMTQQVLQAMQLCREFRPLQQHVVRVADTLPGLKGKQDAVQRVLEALTKRRLLVSDSDFIARFDAPPVLAQAPVSGVYIRACNVPAQLQRLLASLIAYEAQFGAKWRYIVVDDSTDAAAIREHARLIAEFAETSACAAVHLPRERWDGIVRDLLGQLPEHANVLRPLLQRDADDTRRLGGGMGRNLITLLAAGSRYLLLDDDFEFPLKRHPEYQPGLYPDERAFAVRTYATRHDALAAGSVEQADPVAEHLVACGATLGQAMQGLPDAGLTRKTLEGVAPARLERLRVDAEVVMTRNGHRGNSGSASPAWLYMLSPVERAGLTATRESYLARHQDPAVWFGARSHAFGVRGNFTPFAIDNSQMMPCTSPLGRNEDALFNALARVARPNGWAMDFPMAYGHVQAARDAPRRDASPDRSDANTCIAEFAGHVAADLYSSRIEDRYAVFAARLADMAGGSDAVLIPYLDEFLAYRRSGTIQRMQAAAADKDAPIYWVADLRMWVEANGKALVANAPPRLGGWPEASSPADCAALFRSETSTLATSLRCWPAAWHVALDRSARWLA